MPVAAPANTAASQQVSTGEGSERTDGIKKQKAARSLKASNQRLADAALDIARASKRKAELEELRIVLLQSKIVFANNAEDTRTYNTKARVGGAPGVENVSPVGCTDDQ